MVAVRGERHRSGKGFLFGFLAAAALGCAAIPAINIIVDPFWRFGLVTIPGFNDQKPVIASYARMAKPGTVCRLQPRQVALGTSRVEVGIDPASPAWKGVPGPVYNFALAGMGLKELGMTFTHAVIASPNLKRATIGLDFLMFNANREAVVFGTEIIDFDPERLLKSPDDSCLRTLLYDADRLFWIKGLTYVWETITGQLRDRTVAHVVPIMHWAALYGRDGFRRDFPMLENLMQLVGYRPMFKDGQEKAYVGKVWRPPPDQRYCFVHKNDPGTMEIFREFVRDIYASGIETHFYLEPMHSRMMLALQDAGLWVQFEDWKRGLVTVIAEESERLHKPPLKVVDFSGFNTVTNVKIPDAGDLTSKVPWFWEPSHYKSQAGELILSRLFGTHPSGGDPPSDFGATITKDNIEEWLSATRVAGRKYRDSEPGEVALVQSAVDEAMQGAEGSNCGAYMAPLMDASEAIRRGDQAAAGEAIARARAIDETDRKKAEEAGVAYREPGFDQTLRLVQAGGLIEPKLKDWIAYQNRGVERANAGNHKAAADDFAQAIRLIGPTPNPALYYLRGQSLLAIRDFGEAKRMFEIGLVQDPKNTTLAFLLKQAEEALLNPSAETGSSGVGSAAGSPIRRVDPAEAARLQGEADAAVKSGNLGGALELYTQAIEVSPPNTALYYLRGRVLLSLDRREEAAADFESGLALDPANPTLKSLLEQARKRREAQSTPPKAIDAAKAAQLQRDADAEVRAGRLADAITLYTRAIEVSPPNTALHYSRGRALLESGQRDAAAADFRTGLQLDPANETLAHLLKQAQQPDTPAPEAERQFDTSAAARLQSEGDAARDASDLGRAIDLYSRAMAVSPPNTALHYLRGRALLDKGDASAAAKDFEAGLKLDPDNAALKHLLSMVQK